MDDIEVQSEEQADELLSSIESQPPESGAIQDAPAAPQWSPPTGEIPFSLAPGKDIKVTWDKLTKWAQMGHSAPNQIGQLNNSIEKFKAKEKYWGELDQKYGEIDKYVRQNPQFWDHVTQSYQQRDQLLQDPSNPLAQTVSQLQAQLQDLSQFKQSFESQQTQVRHKQEDTEYMGNLENTKKAYPAIDFDTPDEMGKSLEYKILEHANKNGIKSFTTAFRDYCHDDLVKIHEEGAKERVIKERQKNAKLGIMGRTPTPTKQMSGEVKGKSYNDLADEAMAELGLR